MHVYDLSYPPAIFLSYPYPSLPLLSPPIFLSSSCRYIESNYPHYQVVQRTPVFRRGEPSNSSQATFIKRSSDARTWNYHKEF